MGHHYIPQYYLRGFAQPANREAIWMYDKKLRKFTNASIKSVAQEAAFYSAEVEKQLNELVEEPANPVLDKVRDQASIDHMERIRLGVYIATMLMRVPRRRTRAFSLLEPVLRKTVDRIRSEIQEWALVAQDKAMVERRLAELETAAQSMQVRTPQVVIEQIRTPWASDQMIELICAMPWRIVHTTGPDFFITSDNPAHFFEHYGIQPADSELTFPISTNVALFASWQGPRYSTTYLEAKQGLVKEANRRLASGAERFMFYHRQQAWLAKLSQNPTPCLHRIGW